MTHTHNITPVPESQAMMRKTILLDFDGVIHQYTTPWMGASVIPDPPVPGSLGFIESLMPTYEVSIFSTRNHQPNAIEAMKHWLRMGYINTQGKSYEQAYSLVEKINFPEHKPPMHMMIDDRAFAFKGEFPTLEEIAEFKPWNK